MDKPIGCVKTKAAINRAHWTTTSDQLIEIRFIIKRYTGPIKIPFNPNYQPIIRCLFSSGSVTNGRQTQILFRFHCSDNRFMSFTLLSVSKQPFPCHTASIPTKTNFSIFPPRIPETARIDSIAFPISNSNSILMRLFQSNSNSFPCSPLCKNLIRTWMHYDSVFR